MGMTDTDAGMQQARFTRDACQLNKHRDAKYYLKLSPGNSCLLKSFTSGLASNGGEVGCLCTRFLSFERTEWTKRAGRFRFQTPSYPSIPRKLAITCAGIVQRGEKKKTTCHSVSRCCLALICSPHRMFSQFFACRPDLDHDSLRKTYLAPLNQLLETF